MVCRVPVREGQELVFDMECGKAQQLQEGKRLAKQLLQGWQDLSEQEIQVRMSSCPPSTLSVFNHSTCGS